MRESKLKKGNEYLYLPSITEIKHFGKVYFMFFTEAYGIPQKTDGWVYPQIIAASSKEESDIYNTIEDFRTAQSSSPDYLGNDNFIFIDSKRYLKKYTKCNENRAKKFYKFCEKRENLYIKLLHFSNLFLSKNDSFYFSSDFNNYRKVLFGYKIRFYLKCLYFILKGFFRFIICPLIFCIDVMLSSLNSYIKFRKTKADSDFYSNKGYYMKCAYLGINKEEFEKTKKEKEEIVENEKEKYINSNIALFSLILAFIGVILSLYQGIQDKKSTQELIAEYNSKLSAYELQINTINGEVNNLKKEIVDLKDENKILKSEIDLSKSISEVNNTVISVEKLLQHKK